MKKAIALLLALVMVFGLVACGGPSDPTPSQDTETKKVGFVTFGLGGDFFQMLAKAYETKMKSLGWEAYYADGEFNPETQMKAAENYIAMGVDGLVIWSVAPEAMGGVIDKAMEKGIKVIAFVAKTEKYDVVMLSDDAALAGYCAKLAAKWIDEQFKDAADGSVPVAVFTCRAAETGVVQGDVLLKMAEYSKKVGKVTEIECEDETAVTGQTKAENLYTTNPEIKVFLSAHNGLALGINNYFTGISSPVKDYKDMGIFCVNGDTTTYDLIKKSINDEAPLRGTVMTGGVDDTANELAQMITGIVDGTVKTGHVQMAGTMFIYDETVDEYLKNGTVTSVTNADFDK